MANKLLKAFNLDNQKTFRPKKKHVVGTKRYELHKNMQSTLGAGNLRDAVALPRGEDENEWLAVNSARTSTRARQHARTRCAVTSRRKRSPRRVSLSWGAVSAASPALPACCVCRAVYAVCAVCAAYCVWGLLAAGARAVLLLPLPPLPPLCGTRAAVDFFNEISLLYGTVAEFCTAESCPVMSAGPRYEYMWADGVEVKKPISVSAPEYIELLMNWVQNQLDNEEIFPTRIGVPFPPNFFEIVSNIFRRLFRVYGHIYHSHFEQILNLGAEPHLNTCFKHFVYFVREFELISNKQEMAPLQELIDQLLETDEQRYGNKAAGGAAGGAAAAAAAAAAGPSTAVPPPAPPGGPPRQPAAAHGAQG
mmetsp:Transcript_2348/g.6104  ORF Transcript_2348/g.6104 Transcript_2348/m.6104 type:complete len:364 (-) Transcript_2348:436-1527(-)